MRAVKGAAGTTERGAAADRVAAAGVLAAMLALSGLGFGAVMAGRAERLRGAGGGASARQQDAIRRLSDVFQLQEARAGLGRGALDALSPRVRPGRGDALVLLSPEGDDLVFVLVDGLSRLRAGPAAAERVALADGAQLAVGQIRTLDDGGGGGVYRTFGQDLSDVDAIVIRDAAGKVVLRGTLSVYAPSSPDYPRPMRFGLSLPHYGFSLPSGEISPADAIGWAPRAEALGFDSVWVSDHFFYSYARYGVDRAYLGSLEPLTTLAAVAAVTERVRLGAWCCARRSVIRPSSRRRPRRSTCSRAGGSTSDWAPAGWPRSTTRSGIGSGRSGSASPSSRTRSRCSGRCSTARRSRTTGSATLREAVLRPAPVAGRPSGSGGREGRVCSGSRPSSRTDGTRCGGGPRSYARRSTTSGGRARRRAAILRRSDSRSGSTPWSGRTRRRRGPRSNAAAPPPRATR